MQFADPAWQPRVTQEFDQEQDIPAPQLAWIPASGAGTQTQANEPIPDYAQGYRAQTANPPEHDEPIQPPPQQPSFQGQPQQQPFFQAQQPWHRRLPTWAWLLIGVLVLGSIVKPAFSGDGVGTLIFLLILGGIIAWLIYSGRMRVNLHGETQPSETHTFEVGTHPTIVINNKAGSIRLHAGQEGQVSITTTKRGYLFNQRFNSDAQVSYNQDNTINRVSARVDSWKPFGKHAIGFDITVPRQSSLELTTNAGNVSVQNVDGEMKLRSDAGNVSADQVTLHGNSRLRTNLGNVSFTGSLDPSGNYELSTDLGNIQATLPTDASFNLEAKTDLGSVTTNLPLTQKQHTKASGQVGNGPYPRLRAKTDLGSVRVHRG